MKLRSKTNLFNTADTDKRISKASTADHGGTI